MQIGLKPDEVLDMSMDVFRACVSGYQDRLFDMQLVSVHQGYWSGYYSNAKRPKSINTILERLCKARMHSKNSKKSSTERPEVDVESFKALEANFFRRYNERENRE